jgi:DNA-binding response OmpR family regulator/uncharacterized membrane protein (UPF0127 family)
MEVKSESTPWRLRGLPREVVLGREVAVATTRRSRLLGLALLCRRRAGPGLLIPGCRSVHSFGMRFPLDVCFLDRRGQIVAARRELRPGRFAACRCAVSVLEVPAGGDFSAPPTQADMLPEIEELATVVVCEDDEPTRQLLCDHLTADRYRALPAECAADALRVCQYDQPDLMILDLCLPDAGGLDVLRELRRQDGAPARYDPELPVIVLSGKGSPTDRVRGLSEGADDYVVKPFHYPELAARVRRVLGRREGHRAGPVRVGDLVVDPARREATVSGEKVRLSSTEFALLRTLAAEPTRVFTKQELLRDVWGFRSLGRTRTLDTHASRLRRKLDPENTRFIVNCWGVGYRLIED